MNSSSTIHKSWRQWLRIHPATELFPPLGKEDLRALADDIKQHGLRQPIYFIKDVDGNPVLLDGINRLDALELLGEEVALDNRAIFEQLPADIDADAFVVSQNIHRRHLSAEQKRQLIGKRLVADPSKSNLQIAREVRANDKTVASVRHNLEARSEIPNVETRTDTKGRKQQAHKRPPRTRRRQRQQYAEEGAAEERAISLLVEHLDTEVLKEFIACLRKCSICVDKLEEAAQHKIGNVAHDAQNQSLANDDGLDIPEYLHGSPATSGAQS
jgi:ParB-like chromosome segregation protein Spo0J